MYIYVSHVANLHSQLTTTTAELHQTEEDLGGQHALLSSQEQRLKVDVTEKRERFKYVKERMTMQGDRLEDTIKSTEMVCRMERDAKRMVEKLE